jgi:hypothetical protein
MPIDILAIFQPVKPAGTPAEPEINPEVAWEEGVVTVVATVLGVLIVAVVAVLMGMN